jgi:hypothetical protein
LKSYIAAGFDPARFWEITPRLFALEMAGAVDRDRRARALVWWGAMMPHMKKPPGFHDFTGIEKPAPRKRDWRADLAAWEAYAKRVH